MKNLNQNLNPSQSEEMKTKLAVINKANECSVLMTLLCEKMGLVPTNTTHVVFVERFAELQTKSLEYQKELQEIYISTTQTKQRKKRVSKVYQQSLLDREETEEEESRSTDLAEMAGIDTDQDPISDQRTEWEKADEYQRGNYI